MDGLVEGGYVCEGLVGEVMGLKIAPDRLDFIEFGAYFGSRSRVSQCARAARAASERLLEWIGPLSSTSTTGLVCRPGCGPKRRSSCSRCAMKSQLALGRAGVDDELARDMIERPQHGDLPGLSRRRHTQVRARLRPGAGEIGMCQRLALVAIEKNNVAGFGLLFAQLQAQADPFDLAGDLASLQRVPRSPPTELFFRNALDSCERLMRTPSRASISARRRGIVQLRRSATACSNKGVTTRNAVSLFTGAGPGATLAFSASMPPPAKSLRHRRTVSSRTPNAAAIRGLVQPVSVSSTARALSASPRSCEQASVANAAHCSPVAVSGDFPAMSCPCESRPTSNQASKRWSTNRNLLRLRGG